MSHPCKVVLSAVLVGCLAGVVSAAPVPGKSAAESPAGKARAALDQKVTLKAEGKTLAELVEQLREQSKVEVALDTPTLQQFGIDVNTPAVSVDVKDTPLREAMTAALRKMNLRCGVTATGLCVSTEDGLTAKQLRHQVDVTATDRPLNDLLKSLAEQSGANVVFDSRLPKKMLEGPVTLKADDLPVETAVRLAAEIGGCGVVRMGNVLFVTTAERADKLGRLDAGPLPAANPFPVFPVDPLVPPFPGGVPPGVVPGGPGGGAPPVVEVIPVQSPPVEKKK